MLSFVILCLNNVAKRLVELTSASDGVITLTTVNDNCNLGIEQTKFV